VPAVRAVGVQIAVDKITAALTAYQRTSVKDLVKERRSFGFWSPRRCDVYVVSYQKGQLLERLEVVAMLWHHDISADVMYESALDATDDNPVTSAAREGILFLVFPRPRTARRDLPAFKVKSVLRGTEDDVSRQDLVPWLAHRIAEQKRFDKEHSGVDAVHTELAPPPPQRDAGSADDIQILLPTESQLQRKQRKQTKQIYLDRAYQIDADIREASASGIPLLAVDVPVTTFNAMTANQDWATQDDPWRAVLAEFPPLQNAYALQIREAIVKRMSEGHRLVLFLSLRDFRIFLFRF